MSILAVSADGRRIAAAGEGSRVQVLSSGNGHPIWRVELENPMREIGFSPNSKWLVAVSNEGTVWVFEVGTGQAMMQVEFKGSRPIWTFGPDDKLLVMAGENMVYIWDIANKRELKRIEVKMPAAYKAFSADGRWLIAGSDNIMQVWEATTGQEIHRWETPYVEIMNRFSTDDYSIEFSVDDYSIEATSWRCDWNVLIGWYSLWGMRSTIYRDTSGTGYFQNLVAQGEAADSCATSPNGRLVLASDVGHGNYVRIWDAVTGSERVRMPYTDWGGLSLSADKRWLAMTNGRVIWVWDTFLDQQVNMTSEACARLSRNLTQKEWRQYLGDEPYAKTCPNLPEGR